MRPKGDKGDKGATGARGPRGVQGVQGVQGERGARGPAGAAARLYASAIVTGAAALVFTVVEPSRLTVVAFLLLVTAATVVQMRESIRRRFGNGG